MQLGKKNLSKIGSLEKRGRKGISRRKKGTHEPPLACSRVRKQSKT